MISVTKENTHNPVNYNSKWNLHKFVMSITVNFSEQVDFFIAASGHQTRSTFLASMNPAPDAKKFMLTFSEKDDQEMRQRHDASFSN